MIKTKRWILFLCMSLLSQPALATNAANSLDFTLHKLGSDNDGPTVLVIGGIQGG